MSIQQKVFSFVLSKLEEIKIPYMIGGSVASIEYGEPRLTNDMDVVVDIDPSQAKRLSESFNEDYYISLNMMLEAIRNQAHFNIIHSLSGVKVDFYVLKDNPIDKEQFMRKRREAFSGGTNSYFASPEDVILKKLEWYKMGGSQKHLDDINGIFKVSGEKLDLDYLRKQAIKLSVWDILEKFIRR